MLFSDIDFFAFLLRFWRVLGLQVGAKLAVLGSQDPPQSHQNPVFWEHVPKMLPKRLQSKPKRRPKEGPGSIFGGFSIDLGVFFSVFVCKNQFSQPKLQVSYVLAEWRHHLKSIYLKTSSHMFEEGLQEWASLKKYKCTSWVMSWIEKYVNFKPHVQGVLQVWASLKNYKCAS